MRIIAIDGACRRNGKPDCISLGSMYLRHGDTVPGTIKVTPEFESTNQRGELYGLIMGLRQATQLLNVMPESAVYIITDSEYLFNSITKEWYANWKRKGWIKSDGDPVKNQDLWEVIAEQMEYINAMDSEGIVVYHVKGHVIPFGKKESVDLLQMDSKGKVLYDAVSRRFDAYWKARDPRILEAMTHFSVNHGFNPPDDSFKEMIVCNTVADLAAGWQIDFL